MYDVEEFAAASGPANGERIKSWWSEDGKWFCILVDDGTAKATVSLDVDEARDMARRIIEDHPRYVALEKEGWRRAQAIMDGEPGASLKITESVRLPNRNEE